MVISTLGCGKVGGVFRVDVVWAIVEIGRVERSHASWAAQNLVYHLKGFESLGGSEELGSNGHCDGEVRTELIVFVLFARFIKIFVDATTVDNLAVDVVLGIF